MKTLNYAWRFLTRSKSYTIINLLGLAFSLACSIILIRYIYRELEVNTHCIHPESVYIPFRDIDGNVFPGSLSYADTTYFPKESVVERSAFTMFENDNITVDNKPYGAHVLVADSNFFHFFNYPIHEGECSLKAPNDALLMRSFANKIFGSQNPIGKTFQFGDGNILTVRGVLDEPDCKTSIVFDVMLNYSLTERWGRLDGEFIRFVSGVNVKAINAVSNVYKLTQSGNLRYRLVTVDELYWDGELASKERNAIMRLHGSHSHILLLSGVCLLLLLGGVLNFVNIYMVSMMKRSKEYGLKKVFGIHGRTLFAQLWMENMLLVSIALFIAWFIIEITTAPVSRWLGSEVPYTQFDFILSFGVWVLLPLATVVYPFLKYNYLPPVVSIRSIGTTRQSVMTRLSFLFVQYGITFLLIILSLYFGKHLHFLLNTDPGFRVEGILTADLYHEPNDWFRSDEARKERWKRMQQIEQRLKECPFIEQWATMNENIQASDVSTLVLVNDKGVKVNMQSLFIAPSFFKIYNLKAKDGVLPSDIKDWTQRFVVMNEAAIKAFGYSNREEAFIRGESPLWMFVGADGNRVEGGVELMPVTAVIEDYYTGHITKGKQPIAYFVGSEGNGNFRIVCTPGKEKQLIDYLKKVEKEVYDTEDFKYSWLKDDVKAIYDKDRQIATVYMLFAFIAILISCLGLFGLSLFDIRQRYREIAIRKVNGAQLKNLYPMLCRKYMWVLIAAFIVSAPLSYYIIHQYTKEFVVKAPVGIGIYLIALLIVVLISLGTLLWQVRKAAHIDPAKIIKSE